MDEHTHSDLQAELATLQQRLGNLEAEHRELKRQATRTRRPTFSRKFLLSALPVALLLAAAGLLYAVDALLIDNQGNATFIGNVAIGTKASQKTLDVNGTLNVTGNVNATVAGLSIAGGVENLRLLRGMVDGDKRNGLGFKAIKPSPEVIGLYYVEFVDFFNGIPAAAVTAYNEKSEMGDHSAVITHLNERGMWVRTVKRDGQGEERPFSFVVIGPR